MQGLGHDCHHEQQAGYSGEGQGNEYEQCDDEVDQCLGYDGEQVVGQVRVENRRRVKNWWKFAVSVHDYGDICLVCGWMLTRDKWGIDNTGN